MKRYPKYKDSGIEWLGEIPEGWEVKRLRFLANIRKGKKPNENDESIDGLPYLTMDFLRGQQEPIYYMPSQESIIVKDGEILLLWDGANAGEFVEGRKGILSSTMSKVSFDIHKCHLRYCFYFLKAFEKLLRELTIGMGIPHVSGDIIKDCIMPVFSIQHQKSIANFLDQKTSKIDELIKKNEKMVELLKEKRQAIISHAVTKGLDPKVKMKDSGIEWLGEIPEGWTVRRLKYVAQNFDNVRVPLSAEERGQVEGSCPYYGATGIIDYVNDYLFDGEYLLIGEDGAPFFSENEDVAFIAKGKFWVNNHAHILKTYENSDIRFIMHSLNCVDYKEYITGSTRDKLTQSDLSCIVIPLPPLLEQQAIANFLDQKTVRIDELIKKNERLIELLKEYRQALISNVVTGKVRVIES